MRGLLVAANLLLAAGRDRGLAPGGPRGLRREPGGLGGTSARRAAPGLGAREALVCDCGRLSCVQLPYAVSSPLVAVAINSCPPPLPPSRVLDTEGWKELQEVI